MSRAPSPSPDRNGTDRLFAWLDKRSVRLALMFAAFGLTFMTAALLPRKSSPWGGRPAMQTSRTIGLAMFVYANDHQGHYPEGKTSTEVFQQLLDGNYVNDPSIFCIAMPGKVPATTTKLKPENVCWDVTCCVTEDSPDELPLVFSTGFKVTYEAGAKAVYVGPAPFDDVGIAVTYRSNSAKFLTTKPEILPFIATTFDPKGKVYRQLTPDGK